MSKRQTSQAIDTGVLRSFAVSDEEKQQLEKAKAGDARAMDALLAAQEKRLYRFGLRMCGSQEAAQEVLQQTLLTAFQSLRQFRADAQLSTWLFQIARSHCIKARRRRVDEPNEFKSTESTEALRIVSPEASPEEAVQARRLGELLEAGILALPESYREALILKDVEGLSAEEAAEALGLEVANLKSRLHRARNELRANLATLLEPGGTSGECARLAEELGDFAADDIEKATCTKIEEHLANCSTCSAACESLKRTVSLCRRIPGDEVPSAVRSAVRSALERATAK